jgi:hypothetical protein
MLSMQLGKSQNSASKKFEHFSASRQQSQSFSNFPVSHLAHHSLNLKTYTVETNATNT